MNAIIVLREAIQSTIAELVAAGLRHNIAVDIVSNVARDFYQPEMLSGTPVLEVVETAPAEEAPKKSRGKKAEAAESAAPAKAEDKPEPAPKSEPAPAATQEQKGEAAAAADANPAGEAEDSGVISFDEVKAVVGEVAQAGKREELVTLLGSFGAKRAGDLKPEQYGDFLKQANELLPLV